MAFAAAHPRDAQMANMNITPLVDVMLVLLVIFMIAMPAISQTLPINLPFGNPDKPVEHQTLRLEIGAGDVYSLDGVAVGRAELARRFAAAVRSASQPLVVEVRTNPDAEYETLAQGLALARNAGIENLSFVER